MQKKAFLLLGIFFICIFSSWVVADLPGFPYKKTIIIKENSGSDLTDYQIKINISYDPEMQSDFDDLRFVNSTGSELSYWIENYTASTNATVWVKIPNIPASGTETIYMYYGNSNVGNVSNGTNTFELFDDFESYSTGAFSDPKWTFYNDADPQISTIDSNKVLDFHGDGDVRSYAIMDFSGSNYTVSADTISTSDNDAQGIITYYQNENNFYIFSWTDDHNGWQDYNHAHRELAVISGGSRSILQSDDNINYNLNEWYNLEFRVFGNNLAAMVDENVIFSETSSQFSGGKPALYEFAQNGLKYDNVRVRKYASPEPTYTIGAEEDTIPPIYQNVGTNDTDNIIPAGGAINLTAQGYDETGLDWAWLETNETGQWKNYTELFATGGSDGLDGPLNVPSANYVVNNYTYVYNSSLSPGDTIINVSDASALSAGDEILIIQMQNSTNGIAGTYEFRKISSVSGNIITLSSGLDNTYYSGTFNSTSSTSTQIIRVPQYTSVTIDSGKSIVADPWNGYQGGIIVFKAFSVNVAGSINATARGYRSGLSICDGEQGESTSGKGAISTSNKIIGGGGGGLRETGLNQWNAGGGAGGGYAAAGGSPEDGRGGTPGSPYGDANLTGIFLGSGGGGGGGYYGCSVGSGQGSGNGSSGGGIIIIHANSVTVSGSITSNGGDGGYGPWGGGGGGSGGSIYLAADTLTLGNNLVNAIGGAAGTGGTYGYNGGSGSDGRIRLDYNSLSGSTNPTYHAENFVGGSNTWYNSPMDMNDASGVWKWSNFTWQNTSITTDKTIAWRIYYNDTSGNENATKIQTFQISETGILCSNLDDEITCNADPACEWCKKCSDNNQYSGGKNRCVDAGTCNYYCNIDYCGAICDPAHPCSNCIIDPLNKNILIKDKCQDNCICGSGTTTYICDENRECDGLDGYPNSGMDCSADTYYCYYSNTGSYEWTTNIPGESTCSDGHDNDCDGAVDCADTDCHLRVIGPYGTEDSICVVS